MDKYSVSKLSGIPKTKTEIQWWDLHSGHYIKLKKNFQNKIIDLALEKTNNQFTALSNEISVCRRTLAECYKLKRNLQICSLMKIMQFNNMDLSKARCQILNIGKGNFIPKLPFKLDNNYGAEIRAAFLSDGHIPKSPIKQPMYCALELELHERLIKLCKKVFGNFTTKSKFNGRSFITRFPAPINSALNLSGVPRGNKGLIECHVPRDIIFGSKGNQIVYLRRVFDDEGDVCFDKYGKRAVRFTRSFDITKSDIKTKTTQKWEAKKQIPKNTLIFEEYMMLTNLGLNPKIYPEGIYKSKSNRITAKWRIQITQQDNLRRFQELINFSLKEKKRKLTKALDSYKVKEFSNYEGERFVLALFNKILTKKDFVTFGDIGKELEKTGRSYDLAGRYLKILINKKLVKKIRRGLYARNN